MRKDSFFAAAGIILLIAVLVIVSNVSKSKIQKADRQSSIAATLTTVKGWQGTNGEVLRSIYIANHSIYYAMEYDGFYLSDLSNPEPFLVFKTNGSVTRARPFGKNNQTLLALTYPDGSGGMIVLEGLTNPAVKVYDIQPSMAIADIDTSRDWIYGAGPQGVFRSQIKNGVPQPMTRMEEIPEGAVDLVMDDKLVAVACREKGFALIDIKSGRLLSLVQTPLSSANAVRLLKKTLVVADRMQGIQFFDISNPRKPKQMGVYNITGDANDIWFNGSTFYIADGITGIFQVTWNRKMDFTLNRVFHDASIYYQIVFDPETKTIFTVAGKEGLKSFQ